MLQSHVILDDNHDSAELVSRIKKRTLSYSVCGHYSEMGGIRPSGDTYFMEIYFLHGCNMLSMYLNDPWV